MRYLIFAALLSLAACDKPEPAKIAAPQHAALDKAKAVDQVIQQSADASKKKIDDATQ